MESLKEKAYDAIKKRIISSEYAADSLIDEKQLVAELGASRTPVREALIALSQEGYVQILPKRGIFVTPFTYHDVVGIFQMRELLEPWLIKQYGPMLTREELEKERKAVYADAEQRQKKPRQVPNISVKHHPHTLLISKCENKPILRMLDYAEDQGQRLPTTGGINRPRYVETDAIQKEILDKHLHMVEVLLAGDFELAQQLMIQDVHDGRKIYMEYWFS